MSTHAHNLTHNLKKLLISAANLANICSANSHVAFRSGTFYTATKEAPDGCLEWTDNQKEHQLQHNQTSQTENPTKEKARLFYCQLISGSLTLNLKSVNRWGSCV